MRGRDQRAGDAHAEAGKPPLRREAEFARNARAVEPTQARRHVRQQRGGDQIAAGDAARTRNQRDEHEFDNERRNQFARRQPTGAQRAQHRQPLLERETRAE